eukprot:TRINITY_DN4580_c0_g1_i1.p1 TRINITY_DN4580_c0_g1~~TRINITY_DN4580_c0_g1_i1.p1  ORF type:complete len:892 (-),score=156.22 TRINITY_DN4580_c0_g1_i1:485-3058(-)
MPQETALVLLETLVRNMPAGSCSAPCVRCFLAQTLLPLGLADYDLESALAREPTPRAARCYRWSGGAPGTGQDFCCAPGTTASAVIDWLLPSSRASQTAAATCASDGIFSDTALSFDESGYKVFRRRLLRPDAAEAKRAITAFVDCCCMDDKASVTTKSESYLAALAAAHKQLAPLFPPAERPILWEYLEAYILEHIRPALFGGVPFSAHSDVDADIDTDDDSNASAIADPSCSSTVDAPALDRRLRRKIRKLQHVSLRDLGTVVEPGKIDWNEASRCLHDMSAAATPREKLARLAGCCFALAAGIGRGGGADDLLPCLVYAVLRANPPALHTCIRYVQLFRPPALLCSVTGYFLVSLSCAVAHIESLDFESTAAFAPHLAFTAAVVAEPTLEAPVSSPAGTAVKSAPEPVSRPTDASALWRAMLDALFSSGAAFGGGCDEDTAADARYDARVRTALKRSSLTVDGGLEALLDVEARTAALAGAAAAEEQQQPQPHVTRADWRRTKIGAAAIVGGVALAATGVVAFPAVSGICTWLGVGSMLSGVAACTHVPASVVGSVLFGLTGATVTSAKMAKRTAGVEEFHFVRQSDGVCASLGAVVLVPGWVSPVPANSGGCPAAAALECLVGDRYTVAWESQHLARLGQHLAHLVPELGRHLAMSLAMRMLPAAVHHAIGWPSAVLEAASFIDGPWAMVRDRSEKASALLCAALVAGRPLGRRPVTLIGVSLGARLLFCCLERLAEGGYAGLVENAVLLGAPVPRDPGRWARARHAVAGRLVNCYHRGDWILRVACHSTDPLAGPPAGAAPVAEVDCAVGPVEGAEDFDVAGLVGSHADYGDPVVLRVVLTALQLDYPLLVA